MFCCVYTYFYHPETKGRSYEELDEMFSAGVSARKFGSYETTARRRGAEVKEDVVGGRAL